MNMKLEINVKSKYLEDAVRTALCLRLRSINLNNINLPDIELSDEECCFKSIDEIEQTVRSKLGIYKENDHFEVRYVAVTSGNGGSGVSTVCKMLVFMEENLFERNVLLKSFERIPVCTIEEKACYDMVVCDLPFCDENIDLLMRCEQIVVVFPPEGRDCRKSEVLYEKLKNSAKGEVLMFKPSFDENIMNDPSDCYGQLGCEVKGLVSKLES